MLTTLASAPVIAAGVYLTVLGLAAILRPALVRAFLADFAGSAGAHFWEVLLRLTVGTALVVFARQMAFPGVFVVLGWVVVGTTLVLAAVPWRMHRRFARWSVPLATRNMSLLAVGSLLMGVSLLIAVAFG